MDSGVTFVPIGDGVAHVDVTATDPAPMSTFVPYDDDSFTSSAPTASSSNVLAPDAHLKDAPQISSSSSSSSSSSHNTSKRSSLSSSTTGRASVAIASGPPMEIEDPEAEAASMGRVMPHRPAGPPPSKIKRMGTTRENKQNEAPPIEHRPYFVVVVLILNLIMFAYEMSVNSWAFEPFAVNPMYGPSLHSMVLSGAKWTRYIREGQISRLIIPMFLHAGLFHLIMNMYVLLSLGRDLEKSFGWWRITCIYLLSGLFGLILSSIFLPAQIGVGASGALYGLIGAMFGDFFLNHKSMTEGKCGYLTKLIINSVVGLCLGLLPGLDNFNHFGGWVAGIFSSTFFLASAVKDPSGRHRGCNIFPLTMLLIYIVILLIGFVVLFAAVDGLEWCPACAYISCLNTPWWTCPDAHPVSCKPLQQGQTTPNCTRINLDYYDP